MIPLTNEQLEEIISALWEANMKVNKGKDQYNEDPTFYNLMTKLRKIQFAMQNK